MGDFSKDGLARALEEYLKNFYQVFDTDRSKTIAAYNDSSVVDFEGQRYEGRAKIADHLANIPQFHNTVKREIATVDVQVATPATLFVLVTGILTPKEQGGQAVNYVQSLHVQPTDGSLKDFILLTDAFRLIYPLPPS